MGFNRLGKLECQQISQVYVENDAIIGFFIPFLSPSLGLVGLL